MKVGYLGPPGTFSEKALRLLKTNIREKRWYQSFREIADGIFSGQVDAGLFPLENNKSGPVEDALTAIRASKGQLIMFEQVFLEITPALYSFQVKSLTEVKKIISRPELFSQCAEFLGDLKGVKLIAARSTAEAAVLAKKIPGASFIADSSMDFQEKVICLKEKLYHPPTTTKFGLFTVK